MQLEQITTIEIKKHELNWTKTNLNSFDKTQNIMKAESSAELDDHSD